MTYKDKTFYLRSSADIAEWITERRKNYPTNARMAQASQRKRETEFAAAKKRLEHARIKAQQRQDPGPTANSNIPKETEAKQDEIRKEGASKSLKARQKVEKLRKQLEKEERKLLKAESGPSTQHVAKPNPSQDNTTGTKVSPHSSNAASHLSPSHSHTSLSEASSDVSSTDTADITSSSGSSTADHESDEEGPEQAPSTNTAVTKSSAPACQIPRKSNICVQFQRSGKCKYGPKCRFRHERKKSASHNSSSRKVKAADANPGNGRISLYQRVSTAIPKHSQSHSNGFCPARAARAREGEQTGPGRRKESWRS